MDIFIFFFIQFSSKYHQESQYIVFCKIILRKQTEVMGYHQSFFFIIVHTSMMFAMFFAQNNHSITLIVLSINHSYLPHCSGVKRICAYMDNSMW